MLFSRKNYDIDGINPIVVLESGIFNPFCEGYLLPLDSIDPSEKLFTKEYLLEHSLLTVMSVYSAADDNFLGFFLFSSYNTICEGSYMLCYLNNMRKKGSINKLYKDDTLMIYEMKGRGILSVSLQLAPWIEELLEAQ